MGASQAGVSVGGREEQRAAGTPEQTGARTGTLLIVAKHTAGIGHAGV